MKQIEKIEINIFKENGKVPFSAVVKFDDNTELATQGQNYPELMEHIGELLMIRLENDSEAQSLCESKENK